MNEKIGKRIAFARKQAGLTQEKLAESIGVSVSMISRLERGSHMASLQHLLEISEVLHVGLQDLLCDLFVYPDEKASDTQYLIAEINSLNPAAQQHVKKYIELLKEVLTTV